MQIIVFENPQNWNYTSICYYRFFFFLNICHNMSSITFHSLGLHQSTLQNVTAKKKKIEIPRKNECPEEIF